MSKTKEGVMPRSEFHPQDSSSSQIDSLRFVKPPWFDSLIQSRVQLNHVQIKGTIDMKGSFGNYDDINFNFRILKDSAIWCSFSALWGIEIVRCLIVRDTFFIYNKLTHKLNKLPFEQIANIIGFPLNFNHVQHLLMENPLEQDEQNKDAYSNELPTSPSTLMQKIDSTLHVQYAWVNALNAIVLWHTDVVSNPNTDSSFHLSIKNDNFMAIENDKLLTVFPKNKKIECASPKYSFIFDLTYQKISFPTSLKINFKFDKNQTLAPNQE